MFETRARDGTARAVVGGYLLRVAARLDCTVTIACRTAVMGR